MDSQNARLIATCVAGLTAIAVTVRYVAFTPSTRSTVFNAVHARRHRHIAPVVAKSLELYAKLELRALQSLTYLINAFGPHGYNAPGAAPGAMVASPSRPQDRPGGKDENENYFFQWPRDSALCVKEVVRQTIIAQQGRPIGVNLERAGDVDKIVRDFATMSVKLQHLPNRSGTFETGGIGEPKFNVDGTAFEQDWGRPQNDGPALRALTAIMYANHLLQLKSDDGKRFVQQVLYPTAASSESKETDSHQAQSQALIKNDLDYVARSWQEETFELWEEVKAGSAKGGHFHVLMVQRRALLAGARFANRPEIGDAWSAGRYRHAAKEISERLELFWNPSGELDKEGGPQYDDGPLAIDWHDSRNLGKIPSSILHAPHVVGTLDRLAGQPKPCQTDTAVLLGFTHGWNGDITGKQDDEEDAIEGASEWLPWSERCLATLDRLVDVFAIVYPLNARRSPAHGVLCGRYPEDVYDGVEQSIGHPWFLCTHAIAEILYIVARHYASRPDEPVVVTSVTQGFWAKVSHAAADDYHARQHGSLQQRFGIRPGQYEPASKTHERLLIGLRRMADGYLGVCDEFVGPADRMSEQIERSRGVMRGARELSWSYASLLSAIAAQKGDFVPL